MPIISRAARAALLATALAALPAGRLAAQAQQQLFGYFSTRVEKTFSEPDWDGTSIVRASAPREISYPYASIMVQHQFDRRFSAFINLNASGAGSVDVRNMWGEFAASSYLQVRLGKIYRTFGLYNEQLDAVPTYYGIEPPETFDTDHLLLSRTTMLMVRGNASVGPGTLYWSLSTDNGEAGGLSHEGMLPLGADARYEFGRGAYTIGVSGYMSGGGSGSDIGVGEGSPKSGVLPWMAADSFTVWNAYAQARVSALTLQFEYASADHNAQRDPAAVIAVLGNAGVNDGQRARFLIDPAGSATDPANVRTSGDYRVQTWYARAGWSQETAWGEVGPYVQWDWYSNPETIASKRWGGDNEAGAADDGVFNKGTLGVLFRPVPQVAVKLDGSIHFYTFHGESVSYPELRFDVSYTFGL